MNLRFVIFSYLAYKESTKCKSGLVLLILRQCVFWLLWQLCNGYFKNMQNPTFAARIPLIGVHSTNVILVLLKCCCCVDNFQQIIVCLMTFIQMVVSYTRSILKLLLVDFLLHEHSGSPKQPNQMCQVKETNWKLNKFASKKSLN